MTEQTQTNTAVESKKRVRSPAYPGIDLEEAIQRAEVIRQQENKNEAPVDAILSHWGYNPKSGTGLVVLSALLKFGLIADSGSGANRKARLTPLALKILLDDRPESEDRLAALREAALLPSIHKELWDKYQHTLPSDMTMRLYLRKDRGFHDDAADDLIEEFRATLTYARIGESAKLSPQAEDKETPVGEVNMSPTLTNSPAKQEQPPVQKIADGSRQTTRTVQIPLTDAPWASIQIPYPISEATWDEMMSFLGLMKRPFTNVKTEAQKEQDASSSGSVTTT